MKTSPDILVYDNMLVGVPKSATLTITNVSDSDISVTPYFDLGSEYTPFLTHKLDLCNAGTCSPVTASTKMNIPKNGNQELLVSITMIKDLPKNMKSVSVQSGLQVTGEVFEADKTVEIIPQNKPAPPLAYTGVSPDVFKIMGLSGVLAMIGYGLLAFAQRRRTEEEPE